MALLANSAARISNVQALKSTRTTATARPTVAVTKASVVSDWYLKYCKSAPDSKTAYYGAERGLWHGASADKVPSHLDGTLPADFGFDPLALGRKGGDDLAKLGEQEVIHGRYAMLAVTGMAAPEFSASLFDNADDAIWYNAGKTILDGPVDFVGNPGLVHASNLYAVIGVQFIAMQLSEYYRAKGGPLGEAKGVYPGGAFDPLGFADDEEALAELKVKEVKNGRLAMLAVGGCYAQSFVSSQGPVADVFAHAADPTHYVLFGSAL